MKENFVYSRIDLNKIYKFAVDKLESQLVSEKYNRIAKYSLLITSLFFN